MLRFRPAVLAAALLCPGCGYVGSPLAPLANVPAAVKDLAAQQRGGIIIAHYTLPAFTTEQIAIKDPLTLDLRVGVWPEGASVDTWAAQAKRIPGLPAGHLATYQIPAAEWAGKEVVIAARAIGSNGKGSAWSNYVILPVVAAPDQPRELRAVSTPAGVQLSWLSSGEHFRILRKAAEEAQYTVTARDVTSHEWTDAQATPGTAFSYLVQTIVPLGNQKEAESELTEVKITPETPPPGAPTALLGVPAPNSMELTWDPSPGDIGGYRVYRAAGPGELLELARVSAIPAYSDRSVEHGKTYRYAVSAVDLAGREGPRSAIKEGTMQ